MTFYVHTIENERGGWFRDSMANIFCYFESYKYIGTEAVNFYSNGCLIASILLNENKVDFVKISEDQE